MHVFVIWCLWFGWCNTPPPPPPPTTVYTAPSTSSATSSPGGFTGMGNGTTDVEQWCPLVQTYFPTETDYALCIIAEESGGNPNAVNMQGSGAAGLFQIKPFWWDAYGGNPFDPETNVALAAVIRATPQGWSHWSASARC